MQHLLVLDDRFESIKISLVLDNVGADMDEMLLCLMWSVRCYVRRVQQYSLACRHLVSADRVKVGIS